MLDTAVATKTGVLSFQPLDGEKVSGVNTLCQLSRLASLTQLLEYEGLVKVADLERYGDFGVGAPFLLGELNILEGEVYQALHDGVIIKTDMQQTVPFAQMTHFKVDFYHQLSSASDIRDFESQLDLLIAPYGREFFYAVKIHGQFPMMRCRSVYFQKKPFKSMERVMEEDQVITVWVDISGTLISIYCPDFIRTLSPIGWHFHFLSDDRKLGGHVLDFRIEKAVAEFDKIPQFALLLPEG